MVGIDDTSVYSIADGIIDATPYEKNGFGYYIRQLLSDGKRIYYGHLKKDSICVKPGQTVKKGDKLGVMGSTGKSTGAHTHLELRPAGTSKDSLDICEYTGIPNIKDTYYYEENNDIEFADVPKNHWSYSEITEVSKSGIMTGFPDGTFRPEEPVTRAQLASVICRMKG